MKLGLDDMASEYEHLLRKYMEDDISENESEEIRLQLLQMHEFLGLSTIGIITASLLQEKELQEKDMQARDPHPSDGVDKAYESHVHDDLFKD